MAPGAWSSCDGGRRALRGSRDDRMALRVELQRTQRRREAAQQFVGELQPRRGHAPVSLRGRAVSAPGGPAPRCARRADALGRLFEDSNAAGRADPRQRRAAAARMSRCGAAPTTRLCRAPPSAAAMPLRIFQGAERLDGADVHRRQRARDDRHCAGCRRTTAPRARRAPS